MKYSILTSIYKSQPFLNSYFETIFNQNMKPNEIILIDDTKNPENLIDILNEKKTKYGFNNIFILHNNKNMGPAASLNKGLKKCSNNLIFRLDVDDQWLPNHTQKMLEFYNKDKNYLIYANSLKKINFLTNLKCDSFFINENHLIHSSWLINRNICKDFKYHMITPSVALEDYFTLLYYIKKKFKIFFTYDLTTKYIQVAESHGRLNLTNIKYLKFRKLISNLFLKLYFKEKNLLSFTYFFFRKYGIFRFIVFIFWIQDYFKFKKFYYKLKK